MITLEANYSKKIGLPGYSSHQFSVTLKSELADVSQAEQESARLYEVLQQSVDNNIQQIGYLPTQTSNGNGNGHSNGNGNGTHTSPTNNNGHTNGNGLRKFNGNRSVRSSVAENDGWKCSDKQRDLILKITDEHKLDKVQVDQLAQDRFGKGVKQLNKLEASALIEELLEQVGQSKPRNARFQKAGAR
jgi:hypothetical protein